MTKSQSDMALDRLGEALERLREANGRSMPARDACERLVARAIRARGGEGAALDGVTRAELLAEDALRKGGRLA